MKLLHLDWRRRCSFGKIGWKQHTTYEVIEYHDGVIQLRPVRIVPITDLKGGHMNPEDYDAATDDQFEADRANTPDDFTSMDEGPDDDAA